MKQSLAVAESDRVLLSARRRRDQLVTDAAVAAAAAAAADVTSNASRPMMSDLSTHIAVPPRFELVFAGTIWYRYSRMVRDEATERLFYGGGDAPRSRIHSVIS